MKAQTTADLREPLTRFDVFLSYNSADRTSVERLARHLKRVGLEPWFDRWSLTPGGRWQEEIEAGLAGSASCAVFIGKDHFGDWERLELSVALIKAATDREFRLFPVLLPGIEEFDPADLPPFLAPRAWVDLRPGLGSEHALNELTNAVLGLPFGTDVSAPQPDGPCPYVGLAAFEEADARYFFGRENYVQRVLERLRSSRLVAVVGPSGSGKSSLVRAGVLPQVRAGALPGSDEWPVRVLRPGSDPLVALAASVLDLLPTPAMQADLDRLGTDERTLHKATERVLVDAPPTRRVLIVIDQAEEIFTLCRAEADRRAFLAAVHYATAIPGGRTSVVFTLRADFYPKLAQFAAFAQFVQSHQMLIGGLKGDEIREVIEEPARVVGLEVEPGLVDTIETEVVREPGSLPLLQHALLETWRRRRGHTLTLAGYRDTGGVQRGLAERAEALYADLTPDGQTMARQLLLRLTQPGEGTEDTRRRASARELSADELAEEVVRRFVAERLLTTSGDGDATWVEISHEALIQHWPRLRGWIDSDRQGLRIHRALTAAAQDWERLGRDPDALYRGGRLAEAQEWRDGGSAGLNALERRFLDTSGAVDRAARTAHRRRVQWTITALVAALAVISAVAVVAVVSGREASRQRDIAVSRQLAANATNVLAADPALSLALAMRAYTTAPTAQAEEILRHATAASHATAVLPTGVGAAYSARLFGDGRSAVTTGADGVLRIWDVPTQRITATIPGHKGVVTSVRVSADGTQLASTGADGTVALINLPDHQRRVVVRAAADVYATSADFSPDGRRLAASLSDGTVRLVDTIAGRQTASLRIATDLVYRVAFSPKGKTVVTAAADGTAQIWNVATLTRIATLRGHVRDVICAVFDPTGASVVTSGADGTVRIWDAASGAPVRTMRVDSQSLYAVAVSPDGRRVAIADEDGLVRIWDIDGIELATIPGHAGSVFDVAYDRNGRLISTGEDGTARVWDATRDDAVSLPATWAAYSLDGHRVVVGDADGHVHVLAANGLRPQLDIAGPAGRNWPAFSPDGKRIVSAYESGSVEVWDAADGRRIADLHPHRAPVWSAVFDPTGRQVLSSADNGTIVLSSLDGAPAEPLPSQPGSVNTALFSPDGAVVASAGSAGTIQLWSRGQPPRLLSGHDGAVLALAFNADGSLLASAGVDGTVRIWRMRDGALVATLRGHQGPANAVDFAPDGSLASTGDDGTVRVWDVAAAREIVALSVNAGPGTTIDISPDGRAVLTTSEEGRLVRQTFCQVCGPVTTVLDLARSRGVRPLSKEEEQRYLS
jgi:WD40 repeat protein